MANLSRYLEGYRDGMRQMANVAYWFAWGGKQKCRVCNREVSDPIVSDPSNLPDSEPICKDCYIVGVINQLVEDEKYEKRTYTGR